MTEKRTHPLTEEELADLEVYREAALARGFATGPVDRENSEAACRRVYRAAGLAEPREIFWAESPMGGVLTAAMLKLLSDEKLVDL